MGDLRLPDPGQDRQLVRWGDGLQRPGRDGPAASAARTVERGTMVLRSLAPAFALRWMVTSLMRAFRWNGGRTVDAVRPGKTVQPVQGVSDTLHQRAGTGCFLDAWKGLAPWSRAQAAAMRNAREDRAQGEGVQVPGGTDAASESRASLLALPSRKEEKPARA